MYDRLRKWALVGFCVLGISILFGPHPGIEVPARATASSCCGDEGTEDPLAGESLAFATCTGSASCRACSTCSSCGHCKRGGTCGVCRPSMRTGGGGLPSFGGSSTRTIPPNTVRSPGTGAPSTGVGSRPAPPKAELPKPAPPKPPKFVASPIGDPVAAVALREVRAIRQADLKPPYSERFGPVRVEVREKVTATRVRLAINDVRWLIEAEAREAFLHPESKFFTDFQVLPESTSGEKPPVYSGSQLASANQLLRLGESVERTNPHGAATYYREVLGIYPGSTQAQHAQARLAELTSERASTSKESQSPRKDPFASAVPLPVVRVVDGDTIVVDVGSREMTVRLVGIDTPETVHPTKPVERFGKEASAAMRSLVEGRSVYLFFDQVSDKSDRYGRTLAHVYRAEDRLWINREMILQGFAHAYTQFPFQYMDQFRRDEAEAREAKRGLWSRLEH